MHSQLSPCSNRGNLSYSDFLSQCVSRQATEPATIELSFSLSTSGATQPTQFRICRTWTSQPKGGRDALTIFQDGQQDPALTKGWDEHIEALLPLGIYTSSTTTANPSPKNASPQVKNSSLPSPCSGD